MEGSSTMTRLAAGIVGLLFVIVIPLARAQVQIGDNLQMKAGGLLTVGYQGDYGNEVQSSHGLNFGLNGNVSGSYYNPNFLSFDFTPYYNQSQANSNFQSLTGASGFTGTANLFTGSHFPGSISYRDDYNSTGTFGLPGQPDFTTHGHGQGFGIGWSALIPGLPTLSTSYSQGSGSGTVYGTDQETGADTKLFNVRSTYAIEGFHLNGYYDHNLSTPSTRNSWPASRNRYRTPAATILVLVRTATCRSTAPFMSITPARKQLPISWDKRTTRPTTRPAPRLPAPPSTRYKS